MLEPSGVVTLVSLRDSTALVWAGSIRLQTPPGENVIPRPKRILTIVIPALNEEASIGDTVRRCLEARPRIVAGGVVQEVEIIVVSDGSTDRTVEIARQYSEVTVLVFERNWGYGAAIKCGFEHGRGELLGFLDADGTCDPLIFADLCQAVEREGADVAIGSRMGSDSAMPILRRVGNALFSWMLGLLSSRQVRDTASGMRVVRRECLGDLYPLPDGLQFTPAMSARILIGGDLKLVEVPMPYAKRVGRSKLSVIRDGLRFFRVIVEAALCYRPARPLMLFASLFGLVALATGSAPLWLWLIEARIEAWMIYRVLLASLLATAAALTLCAAVVAQRISTLVYSRPEEPLGVAGIVGKAFTRRGRLLVITILVAAALTVAWPGLVQLVTSGEVEMHWSRVVLASLLVVLSGVTFMTSFFLSLLELIRDRREDPREVYPPDEWHEVRSITA
ncbi:MAG TPA: glycosyltransferase family 2 protein [Longimicrobiales bacterium]|nr:glycosyltransferase family 2 protein [Longimicrobiales bacterium]